RGAGEQRSYRCSEARTRSPLHPEPQSASRPPAPLRNLLSVVKKSNGRKRTYERLRDYATTLRCRTTDDGPIRYNERERKVNER
ncbi:MAG: hypothetical protein L0229_18725, partial [Blastocatellia bacterium]|nr:hypothetical protein [Blastocatellia bacterium]